MKDTENTIDLVELTARLGLPADQQSAVLAWTGEYSWTEWTEGEADELIGIWNADTARIDRERG